MLTTVLFGALLVSSTWADEPLTSRKLLAPTPTEADGGIGDTPSSGGSPPRIPGITGPPGPPCRYGGCGGGWPKRPAPQPVPTPIPRPIPRPYPKPDPRLPRPEYGNGPEPADARSTSG